MPSSAPPQNVLARRTRKGAAFLRDIWTLTKPYWVSDERRIAALLLAVVVGLNLGMVFLNVLFNEWNGRFYNALQEKDWDVFVHEMKMFCALAAVFIVAGVYRLYFNQMLQMRWRRWLTEQYLGRWLGQRAYYRMELERTVDNPDQRIADDLRLFVAYTLTLSLGLLSAVVTLFSFLNILWGLSGSLSLAFVGVDAEIPGYMVWVALVYAVLGTWLTHMVGRPLIRLNFERQKAEADFRYALVRLRENAEGVALYRGEADERRGLTQRFGAVLSNWWDIMVRQKKLNFFTLGYDQIAVVFPFIVAAPRYFSGAIQLGQLMQISSAFGQVQSSLSYFISAYTEFADWKSVVDRLIGLETAVRAAEAAPTSAIAVGQSAGKDVELQELSVALPDGRALIEGARATLPAGARTLLTGAPGSGKSTLFRALAGIWPFGRGIIRLPQGARTLFLPQRPYLPLGSLRAATLYPDAAAGANPNARDGEIVEALNAVGLGALVDKLDETAPWGQRLSPGEQQRLAVARALLFKPEWLFLDEATSSVDEATEETLYALIAERLPKTSVVSIAHKPSVARFHDTRLRLENGGLVPVPA